MKRVMIVGGPGSGKSTLARYLGEKTGLPVVHIDLIHWKPGWVERAAEEKQPLVDAVHARPEWIFEGGHSRSWKARAMRADTLIWLDMPLPLRLWRVFRRRVEYRGGQSRPDLPQDCPERLDPEFLRYIVNSNRAVRARITRLIAEFPHLTTHILRSPRALARWKAAL